jgi:hypothetical protein
LARALLSFERIPEIRSQCGRILSKTRSPHDFTSLAQETSITAAASWLRPGFATIGG